MKLPHEGLAHEAVLAELEALKRQDADPQTGRLFSLVYPAGEDVDALLRDANLLYLHDNALNPLRTPSLRKMELDVITMTADLLNGDQLVRGAMTSGGTESILMAVKTARDRGAAERQVKRPNMLIPVSAHPAFAKGASYFGLELRKIPLGPDFRADPDRARDLADRNTVLVVGSAPNYPHGVIDPIEELAAMAAELGASFHTDCCVGGFLLPFLERLGKKLPLYDFRVPGVTTISADVHKYGYCTKGASVILHRSADSFQYQPFVYHEWPGGIYGSFSMAGARAAAPIAASWAVMRFLGASGYERLAQRILRAVGTIRAGIESIDGLHLIGDPPASVMALGSDRYDIMAIGDVMDERGWHLDRQNGPDALHMMISPIHDGIADALVEDLREAARAHGSAKGKEARYSG